MLHCSRICVTQIKHPQTKTLKWLGKTYVQSPELTLKNHGTVPPTFTIPVLGDGNTWNPGVFWPVSLRDTSQASGWPCLTHRWCEQWHQLSSDLHFPTHHLPHLQHTGWHKVQAFQIVRWTSRLPSGSFSLFQEEETLILFCLFVLGKCYFYDNYFDLPGALLCARVVDSLTKVSGHSVFKNCI